MSYKLPNIFVSTHSHPKVAASIEVEDFADWLVSTHSHPKVAALSVVILL